MDVRGSGFKGDNYKKQVYKQLGKIETQDILHVIR